MISPLAQKKRQKILLIALGLVILAIVIVFVWGYKGGITIFPEEFMPPEGLEEIEEVELDFTILTELPFADLKSHGDLPVKKGITGRSNPFLPY